ncbi:hypothetical protein HPP92_004147 [Vanilla planifolia]|uniref:Pentatricopeptide repeat-containing protein n=1 Tax=Vanilla planifolia TaxID=51239 RepID=A0A835S3T2_VANPL|nr:hypothetical protein HPP92_004147 [Vanilla planifolia]
MTFLITRRLLRVRHRYTSRQLCSGPEPILVADPSPSSDPNSKHKPLRFIIRSLLRQQDLDRLASDFKFHTSDRDFRSKANVYEIIIRRLVAGGRLDAVIDILEHHRLYNEKIIQEGFAVRLISLYGLAGMPDKAASLFRDLPDLGCPRTVFSFNAVLTAYARSKFDDRIAIMEEFISSHDTGIAPNVISYNILINALCEKGLFDDAVKTQDLMEQRGIKPDLITFNSLFCGFYGKGMLDKGDEIWQRMLDNGIQPDVRSFNAKIRGLSLQKMFPEAMQVFDELKSAGLKPDTLTFNALIKGLCRGGNWEDAKKFYEEMGKRGCFPDRHTLRELIPELCRGGEIDFAHQICTRGISNGFHVDVGVVQVMVDELVKASKYMKAKKLVILARSKKKVKLRMPLPCLYA